MSRPGHRWLRRFASSSLLCAVFACSLDYSVGPFERPDGGPERDGAIADEGGGSPDANGGGANRASVQVKTTPRTNGEVFPLKIDPTQASNLVVVIVAQETNKEITVRSIADNAPGGSNTYQSANARSIYPDCNSRLDIWYAANVRPGATSVTVTLSGNDNIEAWVAEFAGMSKTDPHDTGDIVNSQPAGTVAAPKVSPSVPSALVISGAMSCEDFGDLQSGSAFQTLQTLNGEKVAYLFTNELGSYGAVWNAGIGVWHASTVAFK